MAERWDYFHCGVLSDGLKYKSKRGKIFTVEKSNFAEVSDANVAVVW